MMLCTLLIILQALGDSKVRFYTTTASNQSTRYPYCANGTSLPGMILTSIIYISEASYLGLGLYYLWKTRAVPAIVNETAIIGPALSSSILIIVVVGLVIIILKLNPVVIETIVTSTFIAVLIFGNMFYFSHKWWQVKTELNKDFGASIKALTFRPSRVVTSETKYSSSDEQFMEAIDQTLKQARSYNDKAIMIEKHIQLWKAALIKLADEEYSTSVSGNLTSPGPIHAINVEQAVPTTQRGNEKDESPHI